jgi:NADH:ubiquinone oxidoreductase subunit E
MVDFVSIENLEPLKEIIAKHKGEPGCAMPILQETQGVYGYLPIELQNVIAEELEVPLSEIYGIVTFYSQFTIVPKGKHRVGVCLGTACYVRGSQNILDRVARELNIAVGETTPDSKFSLDATRCLGACGLAPVLMIGDDVYGALTPDKIPNILAKY